MYNKDANQFFQDLARLGFAPPISQDQTEQKLERILREQRMSWHDVVNELANGQKETHWCWYFFPNVPGLGQSDKAKSFAVTPEEFLRFLENTEYAGNISTVIYLVDRAVREHPGCDLLYVLGYNEVDVLKWRSFMTLIRVLWLRRELHFSSKIASIIKHSDDMYGTCRYTIDKIDQFEIDERF